jgi:PAS domain S-box-containing protein
VAADLFTILRERDERLEAEYSPAMDPMQPTSDSQAPARQKVEYPYSWLTKVIVIAGTIAVLGASAILYLLQRHLVIHGGESLQLTAHAIATGMDQVLYERHGDIQLFAATVGRKPVQPADIADILRSFKEAYPVYSALSFADRQGRVVATTDSSALGADVSRTAWFRDTVKTGMIGIMGYDALASEHERFAVAFSAPVWGRNGELAGIVHTSITAKSLEEVVFPSLSEISKELSLFESVEYQVLSGTGIAFIDSASGGEDNLRALGVTSAVLAESRREGWIEETHLRRQVPVITGFARLGGRPDFIGPPWRILIRVDRQGVLAPIERMIMTVGVAQAAISLPLCIILILATRKIQHEWGSARAAEKQAQASERRIRQIIETALDAVIVIDSAGLVMEWNSQAAQIFGWERQEVLGQCLGDMIVPPTRRAAHATGIRRVCETGMTSILGRRLELPALHRNGHELLVEIAITEGHLHDVPFFTAFLRDITTSKQTACRLAVQYEVAKVLVSSEATEKVFREIIKSVCDSLNWDMGTLWLVDRSGSELRREQAWHRLELTGETLLADTNARAFSSGIGLPGRVWEMGKPAWILDLSQDGNLPRKQDLEHAGLKSAFAFPLRVAAGEILGVLEFFSRSSREPDVDLLNMLEAVGGQIGLFLLNRRAEEQLRKSETLFVSVVDIAHDAIIAIGKSQRIMLYNQGAARIFGYEPAEVVGQPIDILLPEPLWKSHRGLVEQVFETQSRESRVMGGGREITGRRKNGEEFSAEASISVSEICGERVATVVLRDITEQKIVEEMQCRYQANLEKDIAERTVDLEQARTTAESASQAKSEFLANMSHELRTPMHAILSFANLGIEKLDKEMPEKVSRYLHRIREGGTRLLTLLNDLLDLSKLEAGKMTYDMQRHDMAVLVRTVVEQVELLAKQKSLTLIVEPSDGPPFVRCDGPRISQVLYNLLSNAIKFTPNGKTIRIMSGFTGQLSAPGDVSGQGHPVFAVTVKDEGIGIPADELEAVFDKFVQSKKTKTGAGGTGLGLAICRQIIGHHGGIITAAQNEAGGASVTFTLDQAAADTLVTQEI